MSDAVVAYEDPDSPAIVVLDASPRDTSLASPLARMATSAITIWGEPKHHHAAQVIQSWTRGKAGRRTVAKLRKAAEEIKKQNKLALAAKRKRRSSVAPERNSGVGAVESGRGSTLVSFRALKMATIGFKGYYWAGDGVPCWGGHMPSTPDACSPSVSGEACKARGQWRYEVTLEQILLADAGNVLVGWASAISRDADAWQAGFSNGETPTFTTPTRWWGPVFSRAQLAADAPDGATVVVNVAVELDAPTPVCW